MSDSILTYNKLAGLQITGCHDIVVNGNHFEENQDALRCVRDRRWLGPVVLALTQLGLAAGLALTRP